MSPWAELRRAAVGWSTVPCVVTIGCSVCLADEQKDSSKLQLLTEVDDFSKRTRALHWCSFRYRHLENITWRKSKNQRPTSNLRWNLRIDWKQKLDLLINVAHIVKNIIESIIIGDLGIIMLSLFVFQENNFRFIPAILWIRSGIDVALCHLGFWIQQPTTKITIITD